MSTDRLVYLAHTRGDVREQALFSVLSALAWARGPAPAIHVLTDRPEAFAPIADRVAVERVDARTLAAWRGPADYLHRAKPSALLELARRFPGDALALADADTFFTGPAQAVFERARAGAIVMHAREYCVARRDSMMMRRFRRRLRRCAFRGEPIDLACDMWNSGVVALGPAQAWIVEEWLEFLDAVYPRARRWVLEQFALAYLAQKRGIRLAEARDVMHHYYACKDAQLAALRPRLARAAAGAVDVVIAEARAHPVAPVATAPRPPRRPNVFQLLFGW